MPRLLRRLPLLLAALAGLSPPVMAAPVRTGLVLDRAVVLMRHGVRVPLDGEVPADTRSAAPWPRWPLPESRVTPHGAQAMTLLGAFDRRRWVQAGLVPATGCPRGGTVRIHSNTAIRTIQSGEAYAAGLAPGCPILVDHLAEDQADPLFEPLRAGATAFDARAAVAAIDRYTGGMAALADRHRPDIRLLDRVLDCGDPRGCTGGGAPALRPSADGRGIDLSGPIRSTSGIAQVLLLQYAEGMPASQVGWGRADAATIARLGRLHAALFDVFTRSPYMAAHQASALGDHMLGALTRKDGPALDLLVGHDTNVTALGAALGVDLAAPGYALNDVAPGGAILLERYRDPRSGALYVRAAYQAQPLDALRTLSPEVTVTPLTVKGCATLCPLPRFERLLRARLAPLVARPAPGR